MDKIDKPSKETAALMLEKFLDRVLAVDEIEYAAAAVLDDEWPRMRLQLTITGPIAPPPELAQH